MKTLAASLLAIAALGLHSASAEILVKSGDKIGFMGDSITAGGWSNPAGYVRLTIAGLKANGVEAEAVPAGISGHKSNQMLARLEKDVLSKKPQWMTLSCGVNDVWHGAKGVALEDYQKNITAIIDQANTAGVKPVVLTATVIKEDLGNDLNAKLAPYNEFLRKLAKEKNLPLADLNAMFQEKIKAANKPGTNVYTSDGVHMNTQGNMLMAEGVLKAFGLDAAQMEKAKAAWTTVIAEGKTAQEKQAAERRARQEKAAKEKAGKL